MNKDPLDEDHSGHGPNGDSDTNINEPDEDKDGNVEGPIIEAHVDLAKIACRDHTT